MVNSRLLADGQTYCEGVINRGLEKLAGLREGALGSCRLVNESYCDVTRGSPGESFNIVVYNSKPVSREEYIRVRRSRAARTCGRITLNYPQITWCCDSGTGDEPTLLPGGPDDQGTRHPGLSGD